MDTDDLFVTVRPTEGTSQIGVFRTVTIGADTAPEPPFDTFAFRRSVHRQVATDFGGFHPDSAPYQ